MRLCILLVLAGTAAHKVKHAKVRCCKVASLQICKSEMSEDAGLLWFSTFYYGNGDDVSIWVANHLPVWDIGVYQTPVLTLRRVD